MVIASFFADLFCLSGFYSVKALRKKIIQSHNK